MLCNLSFKRTGEEKPAVLIKNATLTIERPLSEIAPGDDIVFDGFMPPDYDSVEIAPAECPSFLNTNDIFYLYRLLNSLNLTITPVPAESYGGKYF